MILKSVIVFIFHGYFVTGPNFFYRFSTKETSQQMKRDKSITNNKKGIIIFHFRVFAEEAVNEVKRQAVSELQKAVAAAESKATELVNTERSKMERTLIEERRRLREEVASSSNHQEESGEVRNQGVKEGGTRWGEEGRGASGVWAGGCMRDGGMGAGGDI